jgi:hypothetical protein
MQNAEELCWMAQKQKHWKRIKEQAAAIVIISPSTFKQLCIKNILLEYVNLGGGGGAQWATMWSY